MSETTKKVSKKKIIIAVVILALVAALFAGLYLKFSPKAHKGAKEITIEVIDNNGASVTYDVHTDAEYLRQAMEDAKGLEFDGTESDYGLMGETVNGLYADYVNNNAYWAFYEGGVACDYGVDSQPVEDGQSYQIIYTINE